MIGRLLFESSLLLLKLVCLIATTLGDVVFVILCHLFLMLLIDINLIISSFMCFCPRLYSGQH